MAEKKSRVDTSALFAGMIGKTDQDQQTTAELIKPAVQRKNVEKKESKGKRQISIYIPHELDRELSVQGAMKDKEPDKSTIARIGIEIALALEPELYLDIKEKSEISGKSVGEIVKEAIKKGL